MNDVKRFDADEIYGWVEAQAEMGPRRPGSPAGHRNEDYLEDLLRGFGLESVRKEPIPITYWAASNSSLETGDGNEYRSVSSFPIPYTAFTPAEGIEAPLVYADPKRLLQRGDWRGAVVVTDIGFPALDPNLLLKISLGRYDPDDNLKDFNHPATWVRLGWHLYREADRRGATGFIGIVRDQPGGTARMYAPYGFREKDILAKPLPGFWVGRDDGPYLRYLARSGTGRARMKLGGIREPGLTHNVVGEIPGLTDEVIVLGCHHDSPFDSPVEDGSGVAVVLALARHFAEVRQLRRRLIVLLTAGHFYGSIGTRSFIREHRLDVVRKTAVEISIEHVALEAVEDHNGRLVPSGLPEPTGIFVPLNRAVADAVLSGLRNADVRRAMLLPAEGPLGDYPPTDGGDWYEAGVPVVNFICNPVYLLTDDDAFQWVDRARLAKVARAFAEIIGKLDAMDKESICAVDSKRVQLTMKLLKHVARARTTFFGLKPVYY